MFDDQFDVYTVYTILVTGRWSCSLGGPRLMLSALVDHCATGTASSSEPKRQTDSTKSSSSRKKGRIQRAREREVSKPYRESTLLILALVSFKSSWVRDSTAGTG